MTNEHTQHPPNPKRLARSALQLFFNLSKRWELSESEERVLLGSPSQSTFLTWKTNQDVNQLSPDTLDRISYLSGIHKALNILLPSPEAAARWIKKANKAPIFAGESALKKMLRGNMSDLADIRRYLDAQREL